MSFKTNDCQQLSLDDSFIALTERERKALEKSWAKIFADEIFPAIDEERFSVLYSDKTYRPNCRTAAIRQNPEPYGTNLHLYISFLSDAFLTRRLLKMINVV